MYIYVYKCVYHNIYAESKVFHAVLNSNFITLTFSFLSTEMAEKHNAREVLAIARDLVFKLQALIENK